MIRRPNEQRSPVGPTGESLLAAATSGRLTAAPTMGLEWGRVGGIGGRRGATVERGSGGSAAG